MFHTSAVFFILIAQSYNIVEFLSAPNWNAIKELFLLRGWMSYINIGLFGLFFVGYPWAVSRWFYIVLSPPPHIDQKDIDMVEAAGKISKLNIQHCFVNQGTAHIGLLFTLLNITMICIVQNIWTQIFYKF